MTARLEKRANGVSPHHNVTERPPKDSLFRRLCIPYGQFVGGVSTLSDGAVVPCAGGVASGARTGSADAGAAVVGVGGTGAACTGAVGVWLAGAGAGSTGAMGAGTLI